MASREEVGKNNVARLLRDLKVEMNKYPSEKTVEEFAKENYRRIKLAYEHEFLTDSSIDAFFKREILMYVVKVQCYFSRLTVSKKEEYVKNIESELDTAIFATAIKLDMVDSRRLDALFPNTGSLDKFLEKNYNPGLIDGYKNKLLNPVLDSKPVSSNGGLQRVVDDSELRKYGN
ncbi:MAG: hypothetical protein ACP5N2_04535 [Candidatus Nanoarchaeia archaeon]